MRIRFIGDVHAKINSYLQVAAECQNIIQVGDFGMGFGDMPVIPTHRFIRGNHDNPALCLTHPGWIPDGHIDPLHSMMFVGGAASVDRNQRTRDVDWWEDEELGIMAFNDIIGDYDDFRPRVMVTHDCPRRANEALFPRRSDKNGENRTRSALEAMFEIHQPDLWIFGHYHEARDAVIGRTRFICLPELGYKDIDIQSA